MNRRPKLSLAAPGVSREEAAAVIAAVERFMRETTPVISAADPAPNPWLQASLREGVRQAPEVPLPWG